MAAEGKQRRNGSVHFYRQRRVATCAPQQHGAAGDNAHDRIIERTGNGPVMNQKHIGDVAQPFKGFVVVRRHRFIREVATGSHDGKAEFVQQQMMQRCVRQHDAEQRIVRRNCVTDCTVRFSPLLPGGVRQAGKSAVP